MPRSKPGCRVCGEPTQLTVQVWLREFTGERYPDSIRKDTGHRQRGSRKERSIESRSMSFCREHGFAFYNLIAPDPALFTPEGVSTREEFTRRMQKARGET